MSVESFVYVRLLRIIFKLQEMVVRSPADINFNSLKLKDFAPFFPVPADICWRVEEQAVLDSRGDGLSVMQTGL